MRKLLIVANRLPVRCEKNARGITIHNSEGGLATGLASLDADYEKEWVGWPGIHVSNTSQEEEIMNLLDKTCHPVFLSQQEVDNYYEGFSNETLWPLFHYFMEGTIYNNEYWEEYKRVNEKFCDKVVEVAEEGDIIWVQDYHLLLLPDMLRKRLKGHNSIGFFLHIPFPSYELFRTLPWRKEILDGLLGADLIGFHTKEYMQHFINTASRVCGYENKQGVIYKEGHAVHTNAFPMGINFEKFNDAASAPEVIRQLEVFKERYGQQKLVLSVDRLDYTKGIINRLKAFDLLLTLYPELKEKVSLMMLTVPSRDNVSKYKDLKVEVDEMVGYINGRYASMSWTPVHYFYRSVPFDQLVALYNLADIALVTPLRDGMNLVAKEYVASKTHGNGVLILSEMAGSALELEDALRVNPNDQRDMAEALHAALNMSSSEQQRRMAKMQERVRTNSVKKWGFDFINELNAVCQTVPVEITSVYSEETAEISAAFNQAGERLIILDYDGTLAPFCDNPAEAKPDQELKALLMQLHDQATVLLLSGRDHHTMEKWFGNYGIQLVAEHGVWHKEKEQWTQEVNGNTAWKSNVIPLLQEFVDKTPGAFIEEKSSSLVFHYRKSNSWLADIRVRQLMEALAPVCVLDHLDILEGNKVVEIRMPGVNKGTACDHWLSKRHWDFILSIGDDKTDEDMFAAMPRTAYTIKVGKQESKARLRIGNFAKVREFLRHLLEQQQNNQNLRLSYKRAV